MSVKTGFQTNAKESPGEKKILPRQIIIRPPWPKSPAKRPHLKCCCCPGRNETLGNDVKGHAQIPLSARPCTVRYRRYWLPWIGLTLL